ncbi:polysaccharide pyruvyl transferase family protein [Pseudoxanthomonas spadix]|uniref:polysaccharide pyruvyl transferase family protein n=1 Tax=Pseudoxanthomonas spadix TaxID=415229 RepID=UPI000F007FE9|nr:polysaccharide pyruvyl transferase family protein [Pseudoxanthomonas spadix]MBP3974107.1 polysaccharide pyruvyl transferase family protein [Pseudoxanthomonas spadix]RMW96316.1 polysaccharide pyruvyl transferase family protein [Pseudoxanthomonas spadix]
MPLIEGIVERQERKSLFWWKPKDGSVNVGDHLSKVLVSSILALQDTNLLRKRPGTPRLLCIGSVLHFATGGEVVWGTGINGKIPASAHRFTALDVRAVRGPGTREVLGSMGIPAPPVYGDPALLMPRLFNADLLRSGAPRKPYVVVPHFNEPLDKYRGYEDRLVSPRIEPAAFVSQLLEAEYVVSSSLHGVILAEAYGIPAVYLDWGNGEDRFKYDDYYAGTGRMQWRSGNSVEECLDIGGNGRFDLASIQRGLMDTFPYDLW